MIRGLILTKSKIKWENRSTAQKKKIATAQFKSKGATGASEFLGVTKKTIYNNLDRRRSRVKKRRVIPKAKPKAKDERPQFEEPKRINFGGVKYRGVTLQLRMKNIKTGSTVNYWWKFVFMNWRGYESLMTKSQIDSNLNRVLDTIEDRVRLQTSDDYRIVGVKEIHYMRVETGKQRRYLTPQLAK